MKTMLACDANLDKLDKLPYPVVVQPKIDGVRGRVLGGQLIARSMKSHVNRHIRMKFGIPELEGMDFEMTLGSDPAAPDLCRLTSGAARRAEGFPDIHIWVFDILPQHPDEGYSARRDRLRELLWDASGPLQAKLHLVPCFIATNPETLLAYEEMALAQGYEGIIIRDPFGKYKEGRSTVKEAGLLRIKRFVEEEAEVIELIEAMQNCNEAKTNELGHSERSTHKENMVPKGMLGMIRCRDIKTQKIIDVGPGTLTHAERKHYWENPSELLKATIKYKKFPVGEKDKPRFPTFVCIRNVEDM